MYSSRYVIGQLGTILKSASRVIRIGEFQLQRDSAIRRLASSGFSVIRVGDFQLRCSSEIHRLSGFGSCVIPVGEFKPLRHFRVSRLPIHDPSAKQEALSIRCQSKNEDSANKSWMATPTSPSVLDAHT
ncbi:MAG: hypothetical protein ABIS50_16560 [Luteolibacter sp.]